MSVVRHTRMETDSSRPELGEGRLQDGARAVSASERERIAEGAVAEVFAWGEGRVLKLFREGFSRELAELEAYCARIAVNAGLSTPDVLEVLTVDGRAGIVFERVDGNSMLEALLSRPEDCATLAEQMADLHIALHGYAVTGLPSQRERLTQRIGWAKGLSEATKSALIAAMERLPDGDALCHGDFHPGNILLAGRGAVVIDWVDATAGNPLVDVARTYLLINTGRLPESLSTEIRERIERMRGRLWDAYIRRYELRSPFPTEGWKAWLPCVSAARLCEPGLHRDEVSALLRLASLLE